MQQRYCLEVSYFGKNYHGSQSQINAQTIQSELEKALQIFYRKSFSLVGASRTDKGVHAIQNFYHVDTAMPILQEQVYNINSILPPDISITGIYKTSVGFHARFDAVSREYKYYIHTAKNPFLNGRSWYFPYKLSHELLKEYAAIILNTHDFTSFSKKGTEVKSTLCKIEKANWIIKEDEIIFHVKANRFLRGMVRGLTATMLQGARKETPVVTFGSIMAGNNNMQADFSAPSHGLYLCAIEYPLNSFVKI
ncbi:MAG: tRNA pseudouridine(38-40) synthase TruA [Bacteroidota bacterium]